MNKYFSSLIFFFFFCHFSQDAIQIDDDLLANSNRSLETLVSVGMTLGLSKRVSDREREVLDLDKCTLTE